MAAGETTIKTLAIASLIFTIMAIASVGIVSQISSSAGSQINESRIETFNSSFNKLVEIDYEYETLYNTTTKEESTNPIFNLFDTIFNKASSIMRGVKTSFSFLDDFFDGLANVLGLPRFLVDILNLLITVIIMFSFLRLIFQREP